MDKPFVDIVEIYEVRYPDKRQEERFSKVLFRGKDAAHRFARRYGVAVIPTAVTSTEFAHLRRSGKFEGSPGMRLKTYEEQR